MIAGRQIGQRRVKNPIFRIQAIHVCDHFVVDEELGARGVSALAVDGKIRIDRWILRGRKHANETRRQEMLSTDR